MRNSIRLVAVLIAAMGLCVSAAAQMGGVPSGQNDSAAEGSSLPSNNHMGRNNMTQDEFNQLSEYVDQAKRLTADDRKKGKTEADLKAEDVANATSLVRALSLPCMVADASLVAQGGDKDAKFRAYETSCSNGMGYFVVSRAGGKPYAFSCFTAAAKAKSDAIAGKQGDAVCRLPADADINAMATNILSRAGMNCAVRQVGYIGEDSTTDTEYNEAVCANGEGYMLATAVPGSKAAPQMATCHDSAMKGIACKLAGGGQAVPVLTIQTFKDALVRHNVPCDASQVRVIGQQNASKRYVVEFECPQQPKGLVVLIPLGDNTAPFQSFNCAQAVKLGAACKLGRAAN